MAEIILKFIVLLLWTVCKANIADDFCCENDIFIFDNVSGACLYFLLITCVLYFKIEAQLYFSSNDSLKMSNSPDVHRNQVTAVTPNWLFWLQGLGASIKHVFGSITKSRKTKS